MGPSWRQLREDESYCGFLLIYFGPQVPGQILQRDGVEIQIIVYNNLCPAGEVTT